MGGFFDWFGGGDKEDQGLQYQFQADPYVAKTQDTLFPFYSDLLKGNVPDYYKSIGETGGKEFNDMVALINRDTSKAVDENLVRRGVTRGGIGAAATGKAVADATTKLTWADYTRALTGKQYLMGVGTTGLEGVRSGALNNQNQINTIGYDMAKTNYTAEQTQKANEAAMWNQILSSAIGAAGTIAGFAIGGPAGAGVGAKLGSAGGSSFGSSYAGGFTDSFGSDLYNPTRLSLPDNFSYNFN